MRYKTKKWVLSILWIAFSIVTYAQAPTTDLANHEPSVIPTGFVFEWHEGPLPSSPIVGTPGAVAPGVYYGFYNYGNGCYSEPSPISIKTNACPTETVDLNIAVDPAPAGSTLSFHSALPADAGNEITGTAVTEAAAGTYYVAFKTVLSGSDCYSQASPIVVVFDASCTADSDGDGVTDAQEIIDLTNPNDPCSLILASVSQNATDTGDCDGDGVTNAQEINGTDNDFSTPGDNTDPNDPCSLNLGDVSQNATDTGDCDGDGVTNADEINGTDNDFSTPGDNTDPNDPCSLNLGDVSQNATDTGDCDGDGVTNADEINGLDDNFATLGDNTDPNDPCDYNLADQGTPSPTWNQADCDNDGNPNGGDPNPVLVTATDDTGSATPGTAAMIDILGNDDFLDNLDPANVGTTTITQAGGTAAGTVAFDTDTGELLYTPSFGEAGTAVTVVYEVCNTDPDPDVCATATVTVTVNSPGCNISVAVWLEGAFDPINTIMRTDLNAQGLLPGQDPAFLLGTETPVGQPYSGAPWNYTGTEGQVFDYVTVGDAKAGYATDVVDWVLVSLRTGIDASTVICRQAGLLHSDGTISFPAGCNCLLTDGQQVYIVIEHRNHLPVMTPNPVTVSGGEVTFDFRTQQSYQTFLGDGQKELSSGLFTMYAANGDQTSALGSRVDINATDESIWTINNSQGDSYNIGDFDLNGDVNANDESLWLQNTAKASDVDFN